MTSKLLKLTKFTGALALAGLVSACASSGSIDNPFERRLTWFSYMEGGDLRAACAPGAANQYRLVYNAVYQEQVRTYDIDANGQLEVRVIEPANLMHLDVSKFRDLFNPWRGEVTSRLLGASSLEALVQSLKQDGAFGPPAVGTELSSRGFFWTIAACHEGAYHFTGLAWPSDPWDGATFDDVVFDLDPSPIAVNPPRKTVTTRDTRRGSWQANESWFHTKVGENGLFGTLD